MNETYPNIPLEEFEIKIDPPKGSKARKPAMERYIGTKIVEARPAMKYNGHKGECHHAGLVLSQEDLDRMVADGWETDGVLHGYQVFYQDGYESWSPKDVFEKAYRRTDGLNFGLALEAAKMGQRIARAGWNGKGQYVELGHNFGYNTTDGTSDYAFHQDIGSRALVFVGTRGRQVGWLASQADMLADDWYIVE